MSIALCIPRFDPLNPRSAVENMMLLGYEAKGADYLAFIHDDLDIHDTDWEQQVETHFRTNPKCGMVGFGGAYGLGTKDIYKVPYRIQQLARIEFISNLTDAETHGRRLLMPTQVAVLDGFCQIIRRTAYEDVGGWRAVLDMGLTFHNYDFAMACLLAEKGWTVWFLPVSCTHYGGRTSTSADYDRWLRGQGIDGDSEVHRRAHEIVYQRFRNILPLRR